MTIYYIMKFKNILFIFFMLMIYSLLICLLKCNNKCINKGINKCINKENFIIENDEEIYEDPVTFIILNKIEKFINNKNWNKLNFNIKKNELNFDTGIYEHYDIKDGNITFNNDGVYLIEISGRLNDFRDNQKFNKLMLSLGIIVCKNDINLNDSWSNTDAYGRCSFKFFNKYEFKKTDILTIKFLYQNNVNDYLEINKVSEDEKKKYDYSFDIGIDNIIIKITNLNLFNDQNNYLIKKINDIKKFNDKNYDLINDIKNYNDVFVNFLEKKSSDFVKVLTNDKEYLALLENDYKAKYSLTSI